MEEEDLNLVDVKLSVFAEWTNIVLLVYWEITHRPGGMESALELSLGMKTQKLP